MAGKKQLILFLVSGLMAFGSASANESARLIGALERSHMQYQSIYATTEMQRRLTTRDAAILARYALIEESEDVDGDEVFEPLTMNTVDGLVMGSGGYIPSSSGAPKSDAWGNRLGYCSFDHGSANASAGRINGRTTGINNSITFAVVSPGPSGVFDSNCTDILDNQEGGGDDIVEMVTQTMIRRGLGISAWHSRPTDTKAQLDGLDVDVLQVGEVRLDRETNLMYTWQGVADGWAPVGPFRIVDGDSQARRTDLSIGIGRDPDGAQLAIQGESSDADTNVVLATPDGTGVWKIRVDNDGLAFEEVGVGDRLKINFSGEVIDVPLGGMSIGPGPDVPFDGSGETLLLRGNTNAGVTIGSEAGQTGAVVFARPGTAGAGAIRYDHATGEMRVEAEQQISFQAGDVEVVGGHFRVDQTETGNFALMELIAVDGQEQIIRLGDTATNDFAELRYGFEDDLRIHVGGSERVRVTNEGHLQVVDGDLQIAPQRSLRSGATLLNSITLNANSPGLISDQNMALRSSNEMIFTADTDNSGVSVFRWGSGDVDAALGNWQERMRLEDGELILQGGAQVSKGVSFGDGEYQVWSIQGATPLSLTRRNDQPLDPTRSYRVRAAGGSGSVEAILVGNGSGFSLEVVSETGRTGMHPRVVSSASLASVDFWSGSGTMTVVLEEFDAATSVSATSVRHFDGQTRVNAERVRLAGDDSLAMNGDTVVGIDARTYGLVEMVGTNGQDLGYGFSNATGLHAGVFFDGALDAVTLGAGGQAVLRAYASGAVGVPGGDLSVNGNIEATGDINAGGNVNASSVVVGDLGGLRMRSDARVKTNIREIGEASELLSQITGYRYSSLSGQGEYVGVLAQETMSVLPELVYEDGGLYSVDYVGFIPLLISAHNEVAERVSGVEEKVGEHEQEIAALKAQNQALAQEVMFMSGVNPMQSVINNVPGDKLGEDNVQKNEAEEVGAVTSRRNPLVCSRCR
jgi:hypothetical protein